MAIESLSIGCEMIRSSQGRGSGILKLLTEIKGIIPYLNSNHTNKLLNTTFSKIYGE